MYVSAAANGSLAMRKNVDAADTRLKRVFNLRKKMAVPEQ
jgi:hypothetical protein